MAELFGSPYNAEAAEAGAMAMRDVMIRRVNHPPNNDEYVAANNAALLALDEGHMGFRSLLRLFANSRRVVPQVTREQPGMGPSEAVSILQAVYQDSMLTHTAGLPEGERYPYGRNNPAVCIQDIEAILDDETRHAYFMTNLLRLDRRLQTNRASRYATVEILGQILGKSSLIDIGSGILQGPEQLYHKDQYPFEPVYIHTGGTIDSPIDESATEKSNALLERLRAFLKLSATDIMNPYDIGTHTWSRASLRPTEMLNKPFMDRMDSLAKATLSDRNNPNPRIPFIEADVTSDEDMETLLKTIGTYGIGLADMASIITVGHQIGDPQEFDPRSLHRRTVIGRTSQALKEDGAIIKQDFMLGGEAVRYTDWRPGNYRTYILQKDDPRQCWQEVFVALDMSMCRHLQLGSGTLYINGEYVPIRDAILNA